jgi:hypothetical protein
MGARASLGPPEQCYSLGVTGYAPRAVRIAVASRMSMVAATTRTAATGRDLRYGEWLRADYETGHLPSREVSIPT